MKRLLTILFLFPILLHAQVIGGGLANFTPVLAPAPGGSYTSSQSFFSGITCVSGGSNSTPVYTILNGYILANTTTITTNATSNWQVGETSGGTYYPSLTVAASGGGLTGQPVSIYLELLASSSVGTYNDTIYVSSTGATTLKIPISGTVTSTGVTGFAFSLTSYTPPTGFVDCYGDPSLGVRTATSNGITVSTVATANWAQYDGAAAFDNLGETGSTLGLFPDNLLYHGYFQYSGTGHYADSVTETLSKEQLLFTGLVPGQTYTFTIVGSLGVAFDCTNQYRIMGASMGISSYLNCLYNVSNDVTITVAANSSGQALLYVNTTPFQYAAPINAITIQAT